MAQWQGSSINSETELWKLYQTGLDFQNSLGIRTNIPKYVSFYEGNQWPAPTESTKNLPRPVVNIVKMICRSKKASILANPVSISFKSYTQGIDIKKFNAFAQSVLKNMEQESLDRLAIDDGIKKGSYFFHYYWDKSATNLRGEREGGLRCELIDPLNIFFSNPALLDEQKQKWIVISTPMDIEDVRAICDSPSILASITNDDYITPYGAHEKNKILVLTKYFRINGQVYCERATKTVQINKPFSISPFNNESSELYDSLSNKNNKQGAKQFSEKAKDTTQKSKRATLYPIVCGVYEKKEGSVYGLSEIEGLIPNQKAINFNIAMSLLNAQECAWGKYIALPNALKGQKISNTPGQVLIDHSGTGEGIKRMREDTLSQTPMALTEMLTNLTRTCTGATQVFSGELISTGLSGVAIAQLQNQAQMPIEELKANFYDSKQKQGKIIVQFLQLYYQGSEFICSKTDKNGNNTEIYDYFSSSDYENSVFDVTVEAVGGAKSSVAADISLLDTCFSSGKISLETYIKAYPDSAISNKAELLRQIEMEKESEISKLRKELEFYKNGKTVDPVSIV